MKRKICSLVLLLVFLFAMGVPVSAAETLAVEIPVEVELEGSVLDSEDIFVIELSSDSEEAPLPADSTLEIAGAGKDAFSFKYSKMGIYFYKIRQIPGENPDCTYDNTEYSLVVSVTANDAGELETTTALYDADGDKEDVAVFTNKYVSPDPAKYDPPVEKKVEVKSGTVPENTEYIFAMVPAQKDYPMPENEEAELDPSTGTLTMRKKDPGSYEFGWMYYGEEDIGKTYTYTVKEIPGEDSNFTYDVEIYTMTVVVSVKDRQIELDVSYTNKNGDPVEKAVFTNIYDGEVTPPPKTGDETNLTLYIVIFGAGAAALCAVIVIMLVSRKKKK